MPIFAADNSGAFVEVDSPRVRLTAYPAAAIPSYNLNRFAVEDRFGDLLGRDVGESSGDRSTGAASLNIFNTPNEWTGQKDFTELSECEYILINHGGLVLSGSDALGLPKDPHSVFGIILKHREQWTDSRMSPDSPTPLAALNTTPIGWNDSISPTIHWEQVSGSGFRTANALANPKALRVACTAPVANTLSEIRSVEQHLPNQSHRIDFGFDGVTTQTPGNYVLYTWGSNKFGILFHENWHPCVMRWISNDSFMGWQAWRSLRSLPLVHFRGPGKLQRASVTIRHIAGWLCVGFSLNSSGQRVFSIADPQSETEPIPGMPNPPATKIRAVSWPKGKLGLSTNGVKVSLAYAGIGYSHDPVSEGTSARLQGTITRTLFNRHPPSSGTETGIVTTKGWALNGAETDGESTYTANNMGGQATYTCSLYASETAIIYSGSPASANGVETPFVASVLASNAPLDTSPSVAGMDITRACKGELRICSARPPHKVSRTARFTVDRTLLDDIAATAGWESYLKQFHIIKIEFSEDEGSTWETLFYGYIHTPTIATDGPNGGWMDLEATDLMFRLMSPHTIVDTPAHDLGWLAAIDGADLYGAKCYQQILRWYLGDTVADSLNGGDPNAYYQPSKLPILRGSNDRSGFLNGLSLWLLNNPGGNGQAVTNNSGFLPPPWFSAPLEWARRVADTDEGSIFYWDRLPGTSTGAAVPIYGDPITIMQEASTTGGVIDLFDNRGYTGYTYSRLIKEASVTIFPERNINRVIYASSPPEAETNIIPALVRGEGRLSDADDFNSPGESWERTLVIQNDNLWMLGPDGLQRLAERTVAEFANREIKEVSLTVYGRHDYGLWRVVKPHLSSDTGLGIHEQELIIMTWEQVWEFNPSDAAWQWVTELLCRPKLAVSNV